MTHAKTCNAPGHDIYVHVVPTPATFRPSPRDANNTSQSPQMDINFPQQRLGHHPTTYECMNI